jgi:hypothetical protein
MPGTAFDQFRLFETACGGAVMGGQPLARPGRAVYADARLRARLSEIPRPIAPERPAPSQRYETAAGERGRQLLAQHVAAAQAVGCWCRRVLAAVPSRTVLLIDRELRREDWPEYVAAFGGDADDPALAPLLTEMIAREVLRRHAGDPALSEEALGRV